ncbi:hypothetical protein HBI55_052160 [Parastagonospora nodorum]|nr:hypothetical protein HBI55_052160 [Parastagonospora nodorum]
MVVAGRHTAIQQASTSTSTGVLTRLSLPEFQTRICFRRYFARPPSQRIQHHPKVHIAVHPPSPSPPSPVARPRLHCGTHDAGGPLLRPSTLRTPLTGAVWRIEPTDGSVNTARPRRSIVTRKQPRWNTVSTTAPRPTVTTVTAHSLATPWA